jgi:cytochrome c oxidase subunit IV
MEPIESDLDYMAQPRPASPGSRFNVLLIFPILGLLMVVVLISAAVFQFDLSGLVDSLIGFMLLLFAALVVGLFWAMAPKSHNP